MIERASLEIERLLASTGASLRQIERHLGHTEPTGKIRQLLGGDDYKISSLAELAAVTGRRLVVRFEAA